MELHPLGEAILYNRQPLGVLISNKFDWSEHINKNESEAMRTLGLLKRALSVAPEKVKCLAYKTLCRPKLEYAVEVWDPFLVKHIEGLESVQSKTVRFIGNIRGRGEVSKKREELGLDMLDDRRKTSDLICSILY